MSIDFKKYDYDGWFPGIEGDETAYSILFDKENNFKPAIMPMDKDEAIRIYEDMYKDRNSSESKGYGKAALVIGLIATGIIVGIKTGEWKRDYNWIKSKFKKKEIAISKEKAE